MTERSIQLVYFKVLFILFSGKGSKSHCSGWHAVKQICSLASMTVTAIGNRHRMSTLYTRMHMSAAEEECFNNHMGHAETINRENYAQLALKKSLSWEGF